MLLKHKSEDYKITAVKYCLENDTNYTKTCDIFKSSERSLKRWIQRYEELKEIKRINRKKKDFNLKLFFEKFSQFFFTHIAQSFPIFFIILI
jgi:transposase